MTYDRTQWATKTTHIGSQPTNATTIKESIPDARFDSLWSYTCMHEKDVQGLYEDTQVEEPRARIDVVHVE
jgi:hypothetical protein